MLYICGMNQNQVAAVQAAVRILGSQAALARALNVTPVTVGQWLNPEKATGRGVPPKQCVRIEKLTDGVVTRRDLRPNDWADIWPELVDSRHGESSIQPIKHIDTPEEAFLKLVDGLELQERRVGLSDRRVAQKPFEGLDRRVAKQQRRACDRVPTDIAGTGQGI